MTCNGYTIFLTLTEFHEWVRFFCDNFAPLRAFFREPQIFADCRRLLDVIVIHGNHQNPKL